MEKKRTETPENYDRWDGKVGIKEITKEKGDQKNETSTNQSNIG